MQTQALVNLLSAIKANLPSYHPHLHRIIKIFSGLGYINEAEELLHLYQGEPALLSYSLAHLAEAKYKAGKEDANETFKKALAEAEKIENDSRRSEIFGLLLKKILPYEFSFVKEFVFKNSDMLSHSEDGVITVKDTFLKMAEENLEKALKTSDKLSPVLKHAVNLDLLFKCADRDIEKAISKSLGAENISEKIDFAGSLAHYLFGKGNKDYEGIIDKLISYARLKNYLHFSKSSLLLNVLMVSLRCDGYRAREIFEEITSLCEGKEDYDLEVDSATAHEYLADYFALKKDFVQALDYANKITRVKNRNRAYYAILEEMSKTDFKRAQEFARENFTGASYYEDALPALVQSISENDAEEALNLSFTAKTEQDRDRFRAHIAAACCKKDPLLAVQIAKEIKNQEWIPTVLIAHIADKIAEQHPGICLDILCHLFTPEKISCGGKKAASYASPSSMAQYNDTPWFMMTEENGLSSNYVFSLAADGSKIWLGTGKGLNVFDAEKNELVYEPYLSALEGWGITSLLVDGDTLWIGTLRCLVQLHKPTGEYVFFVQDKTITENAPLTMERTSNYKRTIYRHHSFSDGEIYTLANDGKYIWLGTVNGVYRYHKEEEKVEQRFQNIGLGNKIGMLQPSWDAEDPRAILCDQDVVYVGWDNQGMGLSVGRKGAPGMNTLINLFGILKSGPDDKEYGWTHHSLTYVRSLAQDKESLVVGLASGCSKIKKNSIPAIETAASSVFEGTSISHSMFMALTIHRNKLWAGTGDGLGCYDLASHKTMCYPRNENNPISNYILCVAGCNDRIFCGTEGGGVIIFKSGE